MTKVAVLGCGPTGLVAAHAAMLSGAQVTIYSKHRKSHMFGAQYLHAAIPATDHGDPVDVSYQLRGSIEDYRRKVYGDQAEIRTSPEDYEGDHQAWDIRRTYDSLWSVYENSIVDTNIGPGWLSGSLSDDFDMVLSTVPLPQLCVKGHSFGSQDIWAMGDADQGRVTPVRGQIADNTVICNGDEFPSWYRASNIFGFTTVEWADRGARPPLPVSKVSKPISNTCTCWPRFVRLGRFGMWRKGLLVHHAFLMAIDAMEGNMGAEETRPHFKPCPMADETISAMVAMQLGCRCD